MESLKSTFAQFSIDSTVAQQKKVQSKQKREAALFAA